MESAIITLASARAFVRSLNILLKYARLYGFDHARTAKQFETAWNELHESLPVTNEQGLLLGASGEQLLLDGVPVEATPTERSFAQLVSAAGLASIQFTSRIRKEEFERFVRAFPTQNAKPSVLVEQLKTALAGVATIRINEVRFVPKDASKTDALTASLLTAQALGGEKESVKDWLRDPKKLLQLIAAAEGAHSGSGGEPGRSSEPGGGGGIAGQASTTGDSVGTESGSTASAGGSETHEATPGGYSGATPGSQVLLTGQAVFQGGGVRGAAPAGAATGTPVWSAKDEEMLEILTLLTRLGATFVSEGGNAQPGRLQQELGKLPAASQAMLREALAAVAAKTPAIRSRDPILLRLAEHLAIRFALERYERGEVKVNAVRQMIERMSQEIEGLRRILGLHEQKLAEAGVIVESTTDLLDRQFWSAVPERGKRSVLTSPDAWCVPARNIKQYVEELVQRGDEKLALAVLQNYASCVQSPEFDARRRTAIGLADLVGVYGALEGRPLAPAIQAAGAQLTLERDDNLQGLVGAAFVRLVQEAGARRAIPAMLQALDSIESVERQRPVFAQTLYPRIGLEKRVPEFLDEALRTGRAPQGLGTLLQRLPRSAADNLVLRFNRSPNRDDMQRLVELTASVGPELMGSLRGTLRSGAANDAAEITGLLSRLDAPALGRWLPGRVADWPRQAQDRVVRLVSMGGAPGRGSLLVDLLPRLDPVLLPLAIDEIGLSGDSGCIPAILLLAEGDPARPGGLFVRLKAVEALGRLKAQAAVELLRGIAEGRHMFHWTHPVELRLAALQSLRKIDPNLGRELVRHSGFGAEELSLAPLDQLPEAKFFRNRRYPRVRLAHPVPGIAAAEEDSHSDGQAASVRLEIRGLSLSGGFAAGERHLHPGTLVLLRIGGGLRPIRAQTLMRDARAQGLGFEFAEMDLEERARLRRLLLEEKSPARDEEDGVLTSPPGSR